MILPFRWRLMIGSIAFVKRMTPKTFTSNRVFACAARRLLSTSEQSNSGIVDEKINPSRTAHDIIDDLLHRHVVGDVANQHCHTIVGVGHRLPAGSEHPVAIAPQRSCGRHSNAR